MGQIFHPAANSLAKAMLFGGLLLIALLAGLYTKFSQSSFINQMGVAKTQPVPFSHQHHVAQLGIDCRYCHTSTETSAFAGIPAPAVCLNCHSTIWKDAPVLAPIRDAVSKNQPVEWVRVHDLPDFVYFDHSIHVRKGIGCETCHGRVDEMPLTRKSKTFYMQWCLECHRNPQKFIRPRSEIFTQGWTAPKNSNLQKELMEEYHVKKKTNCSVCHR